MAIRVRGPIDNLTPVGDFEASPDVRDMHEMAGLREHAFGNYGVDVGMPVDEITECLYSSNHVPITVQLQPENQNIYQLFQDNRHYLFETSNFY